MLILLRTLLSLVITPFKESVLKLVPKDHPNRLKTSKWYFIQLTIIIGTIGLMGSTLFLGFGVGWCVIGVERKIKAAGSGLSFCIKCKKQDLTPHTLQKTRPDPTHFKKTTRLTFSAEMTFVGGKIRAIPYTRRHFLKR